MPLSQLLAVADRPNRLMRATLRVCMYVCMYISVKDDDDDGVYVEYRLQALYQ